MQTKSYFARHRKKFAPETGVGIHPAEKLVRFLLKEPHQSFTGANV